MVLRLTALPGSYAVCRLRPGEPVPGWVWSGAFASATRTGDELSVVCAEETVPEGVRREGGWRCLRVAGTLDFSLTGVLASLTAPLAEARVSVFAVSTFDTDYLLLRGTDWERAREALGRAGFVTE